MGISSSDVQQSFLTSLNAAEHAPSPYPHWSLTDCLPANVLHEAQNLPFEAPALAGVSGKRELHNATRRYFDTENQERFESCRAVADAYQGSTITDAITAKFGTDLNGSYLRIEYAQDTDGFWLEPHTDLGVKLFTMLLYLSDGEGHEELGTDIYDADKNHVGKSPFAPGAAMVFIPGNDTYHGFEKRPINGVRKSIIINYVTDEWRAREQLAFPDQPISA